MRILCVLTFAALFVPEGALAQSASVGIATTGSHEGAGLVLDARATLPRGTTLGVSLTSSALHVAYFGGREARGEG